MPKCLHAAFKDVANAQFPADLLRIRRLVLVGKGAVAKNIAAFGNDFAEIDADAKFDASMSHTAGNASRARRHLRLRVVRDQIRDKLPFLLEDLGEQSVKNIARPVRVYALRLEAIADLPASSMPIVVPRRRRAAGIAIAAVAGAALVLAVGAWWLWPATKLSRNPEVVAATSISQPLVAPRLSIVVLPFTNLGDDPKQQYFADSITEDLTTDLSRIADMLVISHNSAARRVFGALDRSSPVASRPHSAPHLRRSRIPRADRRRCS